MNTPAVEGMNAELRRANLPCSWASRALGDGVVRYRLIQHLPGRDRTWDGGEGMLTVNGLSEAMAVQAGLLMGAGLARGGALWD